MCVFFSSVISSSVNPLFLKGKNRKEVKLSMLRLPIFSEFLNSFSSFRRKIFQFLYYLHKWFIILKQRLVLSYFVQLLMMEWLRQFFPSSPPLSLDFSPKNLITIHIKKLEETKEMTANIIFPSHFSSSIVKLKFYSLRKREIRDNFIFPSLIKEK